MSPDDTALNIAHLRITSRIRGLERNTVRVARLERARGHHSWILTNRTSPLAAVAHEAGVPGVTALIRYDANPLSPFLVGSALRRAHADLLHVHGSHGAWVCSLGARLSGIPCLATIHNQYKSFAYMLAQHMIAVSDGVRDFMIAQGIPPERITVVRNGVEIDFYTPRERVSARDRLGLDAERCYFVTLNVLTPGKGMLELLETFSRVHEAFPHTGLLIAGIGVLQEKMEEMIAECNLGDVVHMYGFCSDVRDLLAASDCLVLNSLVIEGLPQVVLEAMAMARPAIATDIGGTREVLCRPELGRLITDLNGIELYEAMCYAAANPNWREETGLAARRYAEECLSVEHQIDGTIAVYRMLLEGRRK